MKSAPQSTNGLEIILLVLLVLAVAAFASFLAYVVNDKTIFYQTTTGIAVFGSFFVVILISLAHAKVRSKNKMAQSTATRRVRKKGANLGTKAE